ncbi:aldo-keto reductase AKR2E4-like [Ostrinia nubilalis]|uniref:aldo-keto reductase AKR2E4-like n=1 Tax=Ostrinia nubilalis TaxID=29057 RepID=UPI00308264E6
MFLWVFLVASFLTSSYCDDMDGGKAPRFRMNDGKTIPTFGLGTFLGFDEKGQKEAEENEVENAVTWALDAGYRLIDTAALYRNEEQVGQALMKTKVPREHIFVVTKLASNEKRDVVGALRKSLERFNQSYVDLYLIHIPVSFTPDESAFEVIDYLDTWKEMEEAKNLGLAKSIGVSNFNISQMERLMQNCKIRPSVLQVEVNLNLAQNELVHYCHRENVVVMAYTPFGSLFSHDASAPAPRMDDPVLVELAERYGKTVPQIVLNNLVSRGLVLIPKSVHKERIEENIDIFDFRLTTMDLETLGKFNKDYRVVNPSFWQDHPYYPFEKVDNPKPDPFKGKKE